MPNDFRAVMRFSRFMCLPLLLCSMVRAGGGSSTGKIPLTDLGAGLYQGFQGGLYADGLNTPPAAHAQAAMALAKELVPRNGAGDADPNGWIVLLSVGMSNTCHEFAVFERQEDMNSGRNARVIILNGAVGGWSAALIADQNATYWQVVEARLAALHLTPQQVQAVWLKEANASPPDDFPGHALQLKSDLRTIVQIIHDKFPNVRLCYLSSRIYGGYSSAWEPQAYENGFSVKWLIEDQAGGTDPGLNYGGQAGSLEAPLLLWGPYLWADGVLPRSDGLTWQLADVESDNVHPSPSGEQKVANLLSLFFAGEPTAQAWYPAQPGASLVTIDAQADAFVQTGNPNTNFGLSPELQVQGGASPIRSFMRFDASAVAGSSILFAKLSLRVTTAGAGGGTFALVDDTSWGETAITANNAPPIGSAIAVVPGSTRDGTVSADIASALSADADGVLALAHADSLAGLRIYHSREASQPPRLVVVVDAGAAPIPALSAPGAMVMVVILLVFGFFLFRAHASLDRPSAGAFNTPPGWRQ